MLRKDQKKDFAKPGNTADPEEVAKFNKFAQEWWNPSGSFKVIHAFNKVRVDYLLNQIPALLQLDQNSSKPLEGCKIFDVGCGAGIVTEPLSLQGADILGIDAAERNIEIAKWHAEENKAPVRYQHALPEDCLENAGIYDVVLSLEVVEHVADLSAFIDSLARFVRPGGVLIIGTLNRTWQSYVKGIIGAEYILGWLPKGTHEWNKFVKPHELDDYLTPHGFQVEETRGVIFNPFNMSWRLGDDLSMSYLQVHRKKL